MNLLFTTYFEWVKKQRVPNFFIEKIWQGLIDAQSSSLEELDIMGEYDKYRREHIQKFGKEWDKRGDTIDNPYKPKIHTIRKPRKGKVQWKAGMDIHFHIGFLKTHFRFAPVLKCISTQTILIEHFPDIKDATPAVFVDNRPLLEKEVEKLALNDGFDNVEDFFKWFDSGFRGKIIHWTDKRY